jgi:large subunit ribosomal protein L17
MRHRVKAKHFNRDTKSRKNMFKNLLSNLFEHGAIETTEPKAKAIKRLADKVIGKAMPGTLTARRILERFFGSKRIVNQVVDAVAPAMKDRTSGFTRIIHLGRRRGDDSAMVKIELVNQPLVKPAEPEIKPEAVKKAKPAAKPPVKKAKPAAAKAPAKKAAPAKKK